MRIKRFLEEYKKSILVALFFLFVASTLVGFYFPQSTISKIVIYYSKLSSLFIVLLTCAYVITTNKQLNSMQKQLSVMESSVNLQIQPLPVPSITSIKLEKIRPYLSPYTNFNKIEVLSRFFFDVNFKNAGTGAALNTTVFASIIIKKDQKEDKHIEIPQTGTSQIHLICEDETEPDRFLLLDKNFDFTVVQNGISKAVKRREFEKKLLVRHG